MQGGFHDIFLANYHIFILSIFCLFRGEKKKKSKGSKPSAPEPSTVALPGPEVRFDPHLGEVARPPSRGVLPSRQAIGKPMDPAQVPLFQAPAAPAPTPALVPTSVPAPAVAEIKDPNLSDKGGKKKSSKKRSDSTADPSPPESTPLPGKPPLRLSICVFELPCSSDNRAILRRQK